MYNNMCMYVTGFRKEDHFRKLSKWRYGQLKLNNWIKKKLFLLRWIFGLSSTFKLTLKPGSAVQVAKHAT